VNFNELLKDKDMQNWGGNATDGNTNFKEAGNKLRLHRINSGKITTYWNPLLALLSNV
jgi:hypothetical protein